MLDGQWSKCHVGSDGGGDGGGGEGGGESVDAAMDEQPQLLECLHA